jgi:NAD(P)H-nitrite reductase large subunit
MDGFKKLNNIFVLRDLNDVQQILKATGDNGKKIAVIGSSFIGMEVGKCLTGKNNNVTIIGMESAPLERVMGKEVGAIFQRQLEKAGVKFYMDAEVEDAKPSSSDSSAVGSVALKDGTNIECDFVILGVGVAPATEYFKSSGIKLEEDGSVKVDDHWRIEGVQDAYAVGDIATYPHGGNMVRIGMFFPITSSNSPFRLLTCGCSRALERCTKRWSSSRTSHC